MTVKDEDKIKNTYPAGDGTAKSEPEMRDLSEAEMKALASAYAKYLKEHDMAPGDTAVPEEETPDLTAAGPVAFRIKAETEAPADEAAKPDEGVVQVSLEAEKRAAAGEKKAEKKPAAEKSAASRERKAAEKEAGKKQKAVREAAKAAAAEERENKKKEIKKKKQERRRKKAKAKSGRSAGRSIRSYGSSGGLASIMDMHDRLQDWTDEKAGRIGVDFARGTHAIASSYGNSQRTIGIALLAVGVMAAALLIIFDHFTVYEYAYNGKILGYVKEQEEVTDVLDVAGRKLTQNSSGETGVEFVANQNVTFNQVDGRGKSTDDADTAVNKLIYMTDIETEAFGVYDGDKAVAIVKSSEEAEELLKRTMAELSTPDSGMELVSAEFSNTLDIRPINVLLSSVQSGQTALSQMVKGGNMETYHIVEEDESVEGLAEQFGVEAVNIYNEDNSEIVTEIEQGDKVCIHSAVEPVSVKMVETGKLKETIEYETIKKESDEYYQGDTFTEQEGVNGVQIFEGTLTKVGGEVVKRKEKSLEVIKEKKDKIILVGTAERPKTAPTGTYAMPINNYVITSEFGGRWGRMHDGMDFGASTGTPIYASDGGTVVRATYYSGYGLCVDIDHENGRMTRYGHCSRLLVSAGDRVYQGQEIALVGNTGHSFGSHLHFEVRINGAPQNPRNYLDL